MAAARPSIRSTPCGTSKPPRWRRCSPRSCPAWAPRPSWRPILAPTKSCSAGRNRPTRLPGNSSSRSTTPNPPTWRRRRSSACILARPIARPKSPADCRPNGPTAMTSEWQPTLRPVSCSCWLRRRSTMRLRVNWPPLPLPATPMAQAAPMAPMVQATPAPAASSGAPFVAITQVRVEQIEGVLFQLLGSRLVAMPNPLPNGAQYVFIDASGKRLELSIDRARNGIAVSGPEPLAGQFVRLVRHLRSAGHPWQDAAYRARPPCRSGQGRTGGEGLSHRRPRRRFVLAQRWIRLQRYANARSDRTGGLHVPAGRCGQGIGSSAGRGHGRLPRQRPSSPATMPGSPVRSAQRGQRRGS